MLASEVAGADQESANARAEWEMVKAQLKRKVSQDAAARV